MIASVDDFPDVPSATDTSDSDEWRKVLLEGHRPLLRAHKIFERAAVGAALQALSEPVPWRRRLRRGSPGSSPSRKNPNLCAKCCDGLPAGGLDPIDITVVFADVRGSTALGEELRRPSSPHGSTAST